MDASMDDLMDEWPIVSLCTDCHDTLALARTSQSTDRHWTWYKTPPSKAITVKAILSSAAEGCPICLVLVRRLASWRQWTDNPKYSNYQPGDGLNQCTPAKVAEGCRILLSGHENDVVWCYTHNISVIRIEYIDDHSTILFELTAGPLEEMNCSPALSAYNKSKFTYATAREWLAQCQASHGECARGSDLADVNFTPCRLIKVNGNGVLPRLVPFTNRTRRKINYFALSYCWGISPQESLRSSNLASYEKSIPIHRLPKSIRDAIHFTREMGVDYLWVDSLCIRQDSASEWADESKRMTEVYKHALCTLAIEHAANSSEGAFVKRSKLPPNMVRTKIHLPQQSQTWLLMDTHLYVPGIAHSPLASRGWAYQERLVSSRIVHFTKEQLFWTCRTIHACERFPQGMPHPICFELSETAHLKDLTSVYEDEDDEDSTPFFYDMWDNIVADYTHKDLTRSNDRLAAIMGLAKEFQPLFGGRFIAGMWEADLLRQLLWGTYANRRGYQFGDKRNSLAPSWSWVSVNTAIDPEKSPQHSTYLADILQIQCSDLVGGVARLSAAGELTVRARLAGLRASHFRELEGNFVLVTSRNCTDTNAVLCGRIYADSKQEVRRIVRGSPLLMPIVYYKSYNGTESICGIVIYAKKQQAGHNAFVRGGLFTHPVADHSQIFRDACQTFAQSELARGLDSMIARAGCTCCRMFTETSKRLKAECSNWDQYLARSEKESLYSRRPCASSYSASRLRSSSRLAAHSTRTGGGHDRFGIPEYVKCKRCLDRGKCRGPRHKARNVRYPGCYCCGLAEARAKLPLDDPCWGPETQPGDEIFYRIKLI